jgi:hypothetical protein
MRIFLDTEFDQESGPAVRPVSIGAIREDGVRFYAEPDWIDPASLPPWMQDNVVPHLQPESRMGIDEIRVKLTVFAGDSPEWWGYCCAYDYLVITQLMGGFMNKPKSWPHYMNDLAQLSAHLGVERSEWPEQLGSEHHALADAEWNQEVYRFLKAVG